MLGAADGLSALAVAPFLGLGLAFLFLAAMPSAGALAGAARLTPVLNAPSAQFSTACDQTVTNSQASLGFPKNFLMSGIADATCHCQSQRTDRSRLCYASSGLHQSHAISQAGTCHVCQQRNYLSTFHERLSCSGTAPSQLLIMSNRPSSGPCFRIACHCTAVVHHRWYVRQLLRSSRDCHRRGRLRRV